MLAAGIGRKIQMTGKDSALRDAVIAAKRWSGDLELFSTAGSLETVMLRLEPKGPVDQRI
ncbi:MULTISPECIES: hypothetical protein [Rhodobacterales]|jgi:hypothetical protein|uniref:hypothetical protein n=1 Tax=Rhodobacterales TaxID=204455 RepID=UPI00237F9F84|nr:hypothetical protein [Phaeobacter gallaeciensis]MDE4098322.1 hypothetical protein [Phaeobacter gallaeciensis]MDE4107132.1 hypothetical protein [Phaeobacter gallaeciensis]MDE4111409.1 hypothetical protein [Phaeobacter gallaeciensis]MDE4116057.1 hypothetical protein [Phaeobacter gallaeciensis]MDE4141077.1 hypothetical protein [Phaeobacter gallaeciensis]